MALEKNRHHYVPQFWIRRFRGANNVLHQWDGRKCTPVSPKSIMQEAWLNTTFDAQWQASNQVEDDLSRLEGLAAALFDELENPAVGLTEHHREVLCEFLALQACRHPDVFYAGHRKAAKLIRLFSDAPLMDTQADFTNEATSLGVPAADAAAAYHLLRTADPDSLEREAMAALAKSPQDPELPITDALRAMIPIAAVLKQLSYEVISAPAGDYFVLGDTPLAQSDLNNGFVVPFSKDLAIAAGTSVAAPTIGRRPASPQEVIDSNRTQWHLAARIVVGPNPNQLTALGLP